MTAIDYARRRLLKTAAAALALPATALRASPGAAGRVIVIGGGFGGATCARYLKWLDPSLDVTLIEPKRRYMTCPFSNLVIGGLRELETLAQGYAGLRQAGVRVVHAPAETIDVDRRRVVIGTGDRLEYDALVVATGIELRFDAVSGYDETAATFMPHAWQAGQQTRMLRQRLEDMPDGGTVIIAPPANPFRCPPGPYERASMIAHYLSQAKPKSKVLILDAKDKFSKQGLFEQAWAARYPGMIEWVAGSAGGIVERVDAEAGLVVTESGFTEHRADVINFIPPQRAGRLARKTLLTDSTGWCPVDPHTFESTHVSGVHVIGDAAIAGAMPKSAFAANNQAKVCAAAIVARLREKPVPAPSYANTCYSLVAPDYAISVSAVYRYGSNGIEAVDGAGGVSPTDADAAFRAREADNARAWYDSIRADSWGRTPA